MNSLHQLRHRRSGGFTLVELMIVVLVISLLTAISVPAYRNHVVKTKRAAGKACMLQYAALLERYYTTNFSYTGAGAAGLPGCATEGSMSQTYAFTLPTLTATSYQILGTKQGSFASRDTQCGNLTLTHKGEKGVSSGTLSDCW